MDIGMRARTWGSRVVLVAALGFTVSMSDPAFAQGPQLRLDFLSRLAAQAEEVVDVTVDPMLLRLASAFMSKQDADDAAMKELIAGLKGIYVKSFEFDREGVYTDADVAALRGQLKEPWARMVNVQSKRDGEIVEVYAWNQGAQPGGLALLIAAPRALTIVNVVGSIDLAKLEALQGQFGIPRLPIQ
jgi:hypothetical protein